ncbi:hypothetical protein ACTFIW_007445 [Dictyostelium discoideum]
MCGVQSKPFKLNISPAFKGIDQSQMETLGGKFYILGEFFYANFNCSVFCNDKEYESIFENSKTISCKNFYYVSSFKVEVDNQLKCKIENSNNDILNHENNNQKGGSSLSKKSIILLSILLHQFIT